jgi:metallo-beta-lactamase family protein
MSKKDRRGFRPLEADELARLTFLGAAGEVTGSSTLIETGSARVLIDCGLCQGEARARGGGQRPFAYAPGGLDAVVLTHGHIDHSGLVPKLVREGFRGPIHLTRPGEELLGVLLRDSARIHEGDTERENRRRLRRGKAPLEPLYGAEDAERAIARLVTHPFDRTVELAPGLELRFHRAGHILGAASLSLSFQDGGVRRSVVFSGDVGREQEALLLPPEPPREADLVILESTYGDRDHKDLETTVEELAEALRTSIADGGTVLVPVFAVGRAQELLHWIGFLEDAGRIPELPVFLDSPMAIRATELYRAHADCMRPGKDQRPCTALEPRHLAFCRTPEESMALNERRGAVILSASGMCEGGRIMHHLRHHLWRPTTDVLFVGFQARGTLGRALVGGARKVRVMGETIAVKARIHTLGGFSAHAGQGELARWVTPMLASGAHLVLNHGEPDRREALAARLAPAAKHEIWRLAIGDRVLLRRRGPPVEFLPR